MVDTLRPLRINAVELLRQPGATRDVVAEVDPGELGVEHDRLAGAVEIDARLRVLDDGIAVTGSVRAARRAECRRCLTELAGVAVAELDELYQVELSHEDAFAIEHGQLDLVPMARETILLELDEELVCRPDCAGLCPECGADRNTDPCACDTTVVDERWSALSEVVLDDQ